LRFSEEAFDLPSLRTRDAVSDDLSDMFDFTQAPAAYKKVQTRLNAVDFMTQPSSRTSPDDD
jgi:hypothetical protein